MLQTKSQKKREARGQTEPVLGGMEGHWGPTVPARHHAVWVHYLPERRPKPGNPGPEVGHHPGAGEDGCGKGQGVSVGSKRGHRGGSLGSG